MRRNLLVLAGLVSAGVLLSGSPASAASSSATLTVKVKATGSAAKVASLSCKPTRGTHRNASAACTALSRAGGDPNKIKPTDGACTMEYLPVKLTVKGRWQGRPVSYSHTHSNRCVMVLATGALGKV